MPAAPRIHRVGFACVTHGLGLTTNHSFRLANLSRERLARALAENLRDLEAMLAWMAPRGLRLLRLGSSFVPFASHAAMSLAWEEMAAPGLRALGQRHAALGFRFSMHPGQYTVLNSARSDVVARALAEVAYSCRLLDLMELDASHKVIVHGGAVGGDKPAALARLAATIRAMPQSSRRRLVLENDETYYNLADLLPLSESLRVPLVFDAFHHALNPSPEAETLLQRVQAVWDCRPKVHVSSQRPEARPGAHADCIERDDLRRLLDLLPYDADLMVEAKAKEEAALRVRADLAALGRLAEA